MILSNSVIINKIALGVALAAPMGPVAVEMIRRGLHRGFLAAFTIRLGAILGNIICLLIGHYGLLSVQDISYFVLLLSLFSSLVLVNMGYKSIRNYNNIDLVESDNTTNHGIIRGFYLSLVNPVCFVFWSGIFAADISLHQDSSLFVNSFIILGVFIWGVLFSIALAFGKKFINRENLTFIHIISGVVMTGYGCKFLYSSIASML